MISPPPSLFFPEPPAQSGQAWRKLVSFRVYGLPKGQPRPRAFARQIGGRAVARVYDSGTAEAWKSDIAVAARAHLPSAPLDGAVRVDTEFLFARPKCLERKKDPADRIPHTSKPDRDNCDKAVLDCLTAIAFVGDDAKVCCGWLAKWYVAKGERPGAEITVYVLEQDGGSK